MTDTRDAFESFAISGFSPALDCSMKGNDYAYTTTHENWLTWQAATLAAQDKQLTDDDIQTIIKMLRQNPTFYHDSDCPVVAMSRKLENMRNGIKQ